MNAVYNTKKTGTTQNMQTKYSGTTTTNYCCSLRIVMSTKHIEH